MVTVVQALNFLKVLWTGHENLEKFQLDFPDPVIPINNERSLIEHGLLPVFSMVGKIMLRSYY